MNNRHLLGLLGIVGGIGMTILFTIGRKSGIDFPKWFDYATIPSILIGFYYYITRNFEEQNGGRNRTKG